MGHTVGHSGGSVVGHRNMEHTHHLYTTPRTHELKNYELASIARSNTGAYSGCLRSVAIHLISYGLRAATSTCYMS